MSSRRTPRKLSPLLKRGSRARFSTYVEVYGPRIMEGRLEVIEFRAGGKIPARPPRCSRSRTHPEDFIGRTPR